MRRRLILAALTAGLIAVAPATAQAGFTVSPPSLSFPDTVVDQKSAAQTLTYSIDAAESTRTTTPAVDGCAPSGFCPFEYTTTCPISPATFPAGDQSCTFTIQFTPYLNEPFSRLFKIFGVTRTAQLSGKGVNQPSGGGKKKKCKKKGKKRSASAAKKCKKKK